MNLHIGSKFEVLGKCIQNKLEYSTPDYSQLPARNLTEQIRSLVTRFSFFSLQSPSHRGKMVGDMSRIIAIFLCHPYFFFRVFSKILFFDYHCVEVWMNFCVNVCIVGNFCDNFRLTLNRRRRGLFVSLHIVAWT